MENKLIWVISIFGLITLIGAFYKMKDGFGPFNLRVIGIILIATFASLLALKDSQSVAPAMGILGGIAGYLFGLKDKT